MQGDPEVLSQSNVLYKLLKALEEEAHLIEHRLESTSWLKLSKPFDCMEERLHRKVIHPLMNRINDLGGTIEPGYAFSPQCWGVEDIQTAYASMAGHLYEVRSAIIAVCNAAESADDYVTENLLWHKNKWIEKKIRCFEGLLARIRAVGLNEYLAENMG